MIRPACPSCEGSGYHSVGIGGTVTMGWDLAQGKSVGPIRRARVTVRLACVYCGGEGRVHPDTLEAYIKNVVIEEDGQ